jgi:putative SOS response-associated peptidase YedK
MPVMLTRESEARWIDPTMVDGKEALAAILERKLEEMELYPVSDRVNRASENDAGLVEPID